MINGAKCDSLDVEDEDLSDDEPPNIGGKNLIGMFNQQAPVYHQVENGRRNDMNLPGHPPTTTMFNQVVPHEPSSFTLDMQLMNKVSSSGPRCYSTPKKVDSPEDPILINSDEFKNLVHQHYRQNE